MGEDVERFFFSMPESEKLRFILLCQMMNQTPADHPIHKYRPPISGSDHTPKLDYGAGKQKVLNVVAGK